MALCQKCGFHDAVRRQKYCKKCGKAVLEELRQKGAFVTTPYEEYVEREAYRPKREKREEEFTEDE